MMCLGEFRMEASGGNIIGTGRGFWALLCETGLCSAAALLNTWEGVAGIRQVVFTYLCKC